MKSNIMCPQDRRNGIKAFIRRFKPQALALQETRVTAERLRFLINSLTDEYNVLAADANGNSGGVGLLVHKSCSVQSWKPVNYCVLWAVISINRVSVPLVNVYSPVDSAERKGFWEELPLLLRHRKFLFLGDWNVVEDPADSSSRSNWLSRQETTPFLLLKARFNLLDVCKCGSEQLGPSFTRFQLRDGKPVWSTLDRIYSSLSFLGGFSVKIIHHPDFPLSDHLPVTLLLAGEKACPQSTTPSLFFKADPRLLQKEDIKNKVNQIWAQHRRSGPPQYPLEILCRLEGCEGCN
ncbi:hypothetical protein R1sor_011073 [Riccia sorocarpa]|uniref:Endonuclease/exonuclease/phosphatase domain-containing protein n=1 Tax=Riccia sorocarpa TaxID=122646 RepID=A0ABD3I2K1_9MARC